MIKQNVKNILNELPQGAELVAAAKGKTVQEIQEAVDAGVKIIGENYIQEAQKAFEIIGKKVKWHFIGHLQKNKIKKAIVIFDMIETVDSVDLVRDIDKICAKENKIMPLLIEINIARETQKSGVLPENLESLLKEISQFNNIKIMGLMTMGPLVSNAEEIRPYFKQTKKLFEDVKELHLLNVEMKYLSMGMSDSYKIAIEEGANMVRVGTKIFGER